MDKKISHIDQNGLPRMVDVTHKNTTSRMAKASGRIIIGKEVMNALKDDGYHTPKGSIIQIAVIAGTMAVKNTYNVIPLCHQISITSCKIDITPNEESFDILCTVKCHGQTGVEMEALHGAQIAALTIYDMCKALSHDMIITEVRLDSKSGGKQDYER